MVRHTRKTRSKTHTHPNHNVNNLDRTMHSLERWTHHMFEELGWMVLAKSYGQYDKINTYKQSVKRLHDSLLYKLKNSHEPDRKDDLKVLIKEVDILMDHIQKDF
jgi:hypothetical protein